MSQQRISLPGVEVRFVDLGPLAHVPLRGHAQLRGHIARPVPTTHDGAQTSAERTRRFRERHGGRVAS